MWLSISTRPDIADAVRAIARYCTAPRAIHWKAALGILEYINGTSEYGITFQRGTLSGISLEVFADADYASKATDRRSVIIIIIIISAHKSDLSNPWSQAQTSLSIPSLHPKTQIKEEKERKK